jgi:ERCC4-type nuclease
MTSLTPFEEMDALSGMVCLVDTREQDTPRSRQRLRAFNKVERHKLDFGDYSAKFPMPDGTWLSLEDKCVIERKMSIDELCVCFCQQRARFEREFERAKAAGARTYLLIESATWENVYAGKYKSRMSEKSLIASLLAFLARYDCQVIFCRPETTGLLMRDILYYEARQRMEEQINAGI